MRYTPGEPGTESRNCGPNFRSKLLTAISQSHAEYRIIIKGAITMASRFSNKLALVAGGTGGLGRAVSLAFLQEGATVAVTFRKQEEFDALKQSARTHESLLSGHQVDVTNDAEVQKMIEVILAGQQRLDILVNTVGGYMAGMKL